MKHPIIYSCVVEKTQTTDAVIRMGTSPKLHDASAWDIKKNKGPKLAGRVAASFPHLDCWWASCVSGEDPSPQVDDTTSLRFLEINGEGPNRFGGSPTPESILIPWLLGEVDYVTPDGLE